MSNIYHDKKLFIYVILDECKYFKELLFDDLKKMNSISELFEFIQMNLLHTIYFDEENDKITVKAGDFECFQRSINNPNYIKKNIIMICSNQKIKISYAECENALREWLIANPTNQVTYSKSSVEEASCQSKLSYSCSGCDTISQNDKKFAGLCKGEENYLSGSEIVDGQTIMKKWFVKNVGVKIWKLNTVKSVLLPSEFSDWIVTEPLIVPICHPREKVAFQMSITINGKWPVMPEKNLQKINLKWLVYHHKLMDTDSISGDFKKFLLTTLDLSIVVKSRGYAMPETLIPLSQPLNSPNSESSIEMVNYSDGEERASEDVLESQLPAEDTSFVFSGSNHVTPSHRGGSFIGNHASIEHSIKDVVDLDLPECPGPEEDDFQISDFNQPNQSMVHVSEQNPQSDTRNELNELMVRNINSFQPQDNKNTAFQSTQSKCTLTYNNQQQSSEPEELTVDQKLTSEPEEPSVGQKLSSEPTVDQKLSSEPEEPSVGQKLSSETTVDQKLSLQPEESTVDQKQSAEPEEPTVDQKQFAELTDDELTSSEREKLSKDNKLSSESAHDYMQSLEFKEDQRKSFELEEHKEFSNLKETEQQLSSESKDTEEFDYRKSTEPKGTDGNGDGENSRHQSSETGFPFVQNLANLADRAWQSTQNMFSQSQVTPPYQAGVVYSPPGHVYQQFYHPNVPQCADIYGQAHMAQTQMAQAQMAQAHAWSNMAAQYGYPASGQPPYPHMEQPSHVPPQYLTNLQTLQSMGFEDDQRLLRLLKKFSNNVDNVIDELLD